MSSAARITDYEEFVKSHGLLLAASGLPRRLHRPLFQKLLHETFDAGDFFSIEPCEGGRQRRLVLSNGPMAADSHVFLVDHAWTFRLPDALHMLKEVPGLVERMAALMCVDGDAGGDEAEGPDENGGGVDGDGRERAMEIVEREAEKAKGTGEPTWLELEELSIDDEMLRCIDLSSRFPNLVALNLWGNKLQNAETVIGEITKCRKLKALWLNDNPVLSANITDAILRELPTLEILNSCFTTNYSEWALGFCGGIYGADNPGILTNTAPLKDISHLDLSSRNIRSLYGKVFFLSMLPTLHHLNLRGNPLDQDCTDELLVLLSRFADLQILEVDIPGPLGSNALKILQSLPSVTSLNGVSKSYILESGKVVVDSQLQPRLPGLSANEPLSDRVIGAMWLYLMTYRLADEEKIDETPVWYAMDELGSALRHSDRPNFRVAPFLFMPEGRLKSATSYSVLWPSRSVEKGEECTRDFLFGIGEEKQRSARLTAWFHTPEHYFIQEFRKYNEKLSFPQRSITCIPEVPVTKSILPSGGRTLLVYTDIPQVQENLKRAEFEFTNEPKDADIIWTSQQVDAELRNAVGLKDSQYINQFPCEACIVMKHHLADTAHRGRGSPEWLQPTYNLETELSALIGDYYVRKRSGLDNLWILKPWNMARTIDTTVTGDLSAIIRLMETGPKICQKYIEHPALFKGRKFDLRYVVLVCSMNPVEIFLLDVFWVRLANNMYSLDRSSLFEYETHFTVMNYRGTLSHMHASDFVKEFDEEHQVKWLDIHNRVRKMIREVFDSAATVHPEMHNSYSRAMYGVDVMLDSCFKPKLLEVTYCPDCTRACQYDTEAVVGNREVLHGHDFFNTVFACLFFGESRHVQPL